MALRLISVLNFHLECNSRTLRRRWWGSGSSKASGTAEQELTWVWQEKNLHFSVGVSWVRLSAENESVSFYRSGTNLEALHTKCFPHLFQPPLSLTSLGGVTGRSKEASRYTDSCHGSKRQTPQESASPALWSRQLHRKQWATNAVRPLPKSSTFKAWLIGKVSLLHRDIPQRLATHWVTLNTLEDIIKICIFVL